MNFLVICYVLVHNPFSFVNPLLHAFCSERNIQNQNHSRITAFTIVTKLHLQNLLLVSFKDLSLRCQSRIVIADYLLAVANVKRFWNSINFGNFFRHENLCRAQKN